MSRYFTKFTHAENINLRFIRDYMEIHGSVNCTNSELEELWRDFSDERYDAQFLIPTENLVDEFIDYLENLED
jgi:hypothetical protein